MTIASRTPEGYPNVCPICGADFLLEPLFTTHDAPCPSCGHLLWWFQQRLSDPVMMPRETITVDTLLASLGDQTGATNDLGRDSLDVVELVMELEEEFDIEITSDDVPKIKTIADAIRIITNHQQEKLT